MIHQEYYADEVQLMGGPLDGKVVSWISLSDIMSIKDEAGREWPYKRLSDIAEFQGVQTTH